MRFRVRTIIHLVAALLIGTFISGCSDKRFKKTYPVSGQVFYEGQPAIGAAVTLRPDTAVEHPWTKPSGETNDSGDFQVSTYRSGDGVPAGIYKVGIVWLPKGYAGPLEHGNKLPPRYADPDTSGITIEVKAGDNKLPSFNLTKE